jgi:hypothetical protein
MADGFAIKVDMSDFKRAMHEYEKVSKRDFAQIVTSKLGKLAKVAAGIVKRTTKETVEAFRESKHFWAFINKVRNKGMSISKRRRAKGAEIDKPYIDLSTGKRINARKWIHEKRTIGGAGAASVKREKLTREMKMIALRVIRRRVGKVKSFVGLFLKASHLLGERVTQSDLGKNAWKTQGVDAAKAVPGGKCIAYFTLPIRADLRETGEGNRNLREQQKVLMVNQAIDIAKQTITRETLDEVQKRLAQLAIKASKRAA